MLLHKETFIGRNVHKTQKHIKIVTLTNSILDLVRFAKVHDSQSLIRRFSTLFLFCFSSVRQQQILSHDAESRARAQMTNASFSCANVIAILTVEAKMSRVFFKAIRKSANNRRIWEFQASYNVSTKAFVDERHLKTTFPMMTVR